MPDNATTDATEPPCPCRRLAAEAEELRAACSRLRADNERLLAEAEGYAERLGRAEAERDRLLEGCVWEAYRRPFRTMVNAEDSGVMEHGWEWCYGNHGGFEMTRVLAVAAVYGAAGLDREQGVTKP